MRDRTIIAAVVVFLAIFFSRPAPGTSQLPDQQRGGKGGQTLSQAELLERFDGLTPAARLEKIQLLGIHKLAKIDKEFDPAVRKDLVVLLQERGSVEGAQVSDVICRVKSKNTSGVATTIKWLIEDGTQVKKGDKLVELDDSVFQDELREQKINLDNALEEKTRAAENLKLQRLENKIAVRFSEIDARMAELELKKFNGQELIEKEILELRLERARLVVDKTKAQAKAQDRQMTSDLQSKEALANLRATKLREVEEEIRKCRLFAPQDGLAIYYIPESTRGGFGKQALVAVGETVTESQKLIQVCKPGHWNVQTRVHEARISEVRAGQKALVRVDAFAEKLFPGKVQAIAPMASAQDWLSADVKVYPVTVALSGPVLGLKPGLSAAVAIEVGRKADVVQVPVQSIVRSGKASYCYVKVGKEIQKRPVTVGLRSDLVVEIKNGVKEGELIVRDPRSLIRRLRPFLGPPPGEEAKAPERAQKLIRVSSFNLPNDDAGRRTRIQSYGLTFKDLDAISALPGVGKVFPVRRLPQEARYLDRIVNCAVVATTPEHAMLGHIHVDTGRFLSADDFRERKNVIVLGAAIADSLFPAGNAMGKDVVIAKHGYTVIGVLDASERESGLPVEVVDNCVYLPLSTYQVRFGERVIIRRSGSFSGEAVQLNDIYLTTRADDLAATVERIRTILEENHSKKNWKIQTAE